jgi:hypothetical protein
MTKTRFLLALAVTSLASIPAHAQLRVFVSGAGLDTNPCTVNQPCRTFQQAYNTAADNGEIDVLDPAGYGPLTITHGISIQAHGFGGITAASGAAIDISVKTVDPVTLNGLVIDGGGTGAVGINITSGLSVQILNSVVRHFGFGIFDNATSDGANLLIEDTIVSDNPAGILLTGVNTHAMLNRITVNNGLEYGVNNTGFNMTIANSLISNISRNGIVNSSGNTFLSKTVISGSLAGVEVSAGTVKSYCDNYLDDNSSPVIGTLTPVTTQ